MMTDATLIDSLMAGHAWFWLILGTALVTFEILMPTTFLLWPGISAILIGLITAFIGPFDWRIQGLAFAVLAVASTLVWRWWLARKGYGESDAPLLNQRAAQYAGRQARVTDSFVNGRGRIALDDSGWAAETTDGSNPPAGSTVEITGVQGALLKVRPVG